MKYLFSKVYNKTKLCTLYHNRSKYINHNKNCKKELKKQFERFVDNNTKDMFISSGDNFLIILSEDFYYDMNYNIIHRTVNKITEECCKNINNNFDKINIKLDNKIIEKHNNNTNNSLDEKLERLKYELLNEISKINVNVDNKLSNMSKANNNNLRYIYNIIENKL